MTQLDVERIKLFSTRSPWACTVLAIALTMGFAALIAGNSEQVSLSLTQAGYRFGLMVIMVMAALAVTTEYRFGTIRATFQAVPNRAVPLVAKTVVVGLVSLIVGELAAFGSLALSGMLSPSSDLSLSSLDDWRHVGGVGLVFMVGSVLAIATGILLRQTAAAVTVIMIWSLLLESMVNLIPTIGEDVQKWMPFTMADHFITGGSQTSSMQTASAMPLEPWPALLYFTAISIGLLVIALVVTNRRDA